MSSIHAKVSPSLRNAVVAAKSRGEEVFTEADDDESDYEEEDSKENDPSLSPSPVDPSPITCILRSSVLGKRPLGDLPTPPEPPSDDEDEDLSNAWSSARNIVANTPNLSGNMACAATSSNPPWRSPMLTERNHAQPAFQSTMRGMLDGMPSVESSRDSPNRTQPSAKRMCSGEGKENQSILDQPYLKPTVQPKPSPLIGLGVKAHTGLAASASRKDGNSSMRISKPKARVGIRRL
jgi:ubiquitin-conjugating enzyme E2 S